MEKLNQLGDQLQLKEARAVELAEKIKANTITDVERAEIRTLNDDIKKIEKQIEDAKAETDLVQRAAEARGARIERKSDITPMTPESAKIPGRYSVARAIQLSVGKTSGTADYGLEKEMQQEGQSIAERSALPIEQKGIPVFIPDVAVKQTESRATVGTAADAGNLVPTSQWGVVGGYRPRLWLEDLGMQVRTALPGQNNVPVSDYLAEGGIVGESDMTPTSVAAAIRRPALSGKAFFSKLVNGWYLQALAGDLANTELLNVLYRAEANILNKTIITRGSGTIASKGLFDMDNVQDVTGANGDAISLSLLIDMLNSPAVNDAEFSEPAWLVSPTIRKALQKLPIETGDSLRVWDIRDAGMLLGHKAAVTTQVPITLTKGTGGATKKGAIFGHFSELLVLRWPVRQLIINPYSNNDGVENKLISFYDWAGLNEKAFAKAYFT